MNARTLRAALSAVLVFGAGCGPTQPEENRPQPIQAPANTPSWVDFPDTTCDEGTPTGLVANLSASKSLVIFFNGGGACWDATTCLALNTSTHGPITRATFEAGRFPFAGSLLDRDVPNNPVKDWNFFFIPYCTGDLHIGDNDAVYTAGSTSRTIRHRGRKNTEAFLARIAATVPSPEQVLVTGSSAGGYGAALNYALVRSYFPAAKVYLVDDSGPLLKGAAISTSLRAAWAASWKYGAVLDEIDPKVKDDFSALYPALSAKFPQDRMALLSYSQDRVIRTYLGLGASDFEAALNDLNATVIAPLPRTRSFVVTGESHTMLGAPASKSSAGVNLLDWLNQMRTASDGAWTSVHP
ncbi:MAG TPA: pectin acetylesterase-family hydrolase [Myxococcaceae bacterium]|nr:pectin acetylesterase-family hydrolase [Myxococcaceae bacterium]